VPLLWLAMLAVAPSRPSAVDGTILTIDIFRAMKCSNTDSWTTEDDDMADLGGVTKYIHTEILTEHLLDPFRPDRKYSIGCLRRQRYRILNPPELLSSAAVLDFGQFVTYDFGVATNPAQIGMLQHYGDFVGVQPGCTNGVCDPRFPAETPYMWFSVGNWCPNRRWGEKGTKMQPDPQCLQYENWGGYIMGGLCPDGWDKHNVVPEKDPTGDRGCTYTYGKSQVIVLDEVAGLTSEDCGGKRCKDWPDFRKHCSNPDHRRKFDVASGQIVQVDYCVEYDIHPACEASCHSPNCQQVRRSGQTFELGIAFWKGRCDARRNQHRIEEMAGGFGVRGSRDRHRVSDPNLLIPEIPCVRQESPMCKPTGSNGMGYCSRVFSGACEQCYIPGTATGPDLRPHCPVGILDTGDYKDRMRFSAPVCKSRMARDLCCLYTHSCDGDSHPNRATLDDDGLALVASLQNTSAMATFLRRAVRARPQSGIWAQADIDLAAYYQWGLTPQKRSLDEALLDVKRLLDLPRAEFAPMEEIAEGWPHTTTTHTTTTRSSTTTTSTSSTATTTATTTTTTSMTTTTVTAGAAWGLPAVSALIPRAPAFKKLRPWPTAPRVPTASPTAPPSEINGALCFQKDVSYEPLDMMSTASTQEQSPLHCQRRCAAVKGCVHFSFSKLTKECHVQDAYAFRQKGSIGFVAGPFQCWQDIGEEEFKSLEWGTTYLPEMSAKIYFTQDTFPHDRQAVMACQKFCASVDGCAHFILDVPKRLCTLADKNAAKRYPVLQAIAGPPATEPSGSEAGFGFMFKFMARPMRSAAHSSGLLSNMGYALVTASLLGAFFLFFIERCRCRSVLGGARHPWSSYEAVITADGVGGQGLQLGLRGVDPKPNPGLEGLDDGHVARVLQVAEGAP